MTYEAGFCVFAFVAFCAVVVCLLYRRALVVDDAVHDSFIGHAAETAKNLDDLLSRDDVLELAIKHDPFTNETSAESKIPPRPFGRTDVTRPMKVSKKWQPWEGDGDIPVPFDTDIVVMFRNGKFSYGQAGEFFGWEHDNSLWNGDCNILAYRID